MKNNLLQKIGVLAILTAATMLVLKSDYTAAQYQRQQYVDLDFERYRTAIKQSFQIDIKYFNERLKGGMADGKAITKYHLEQLLEGIKWEREHTEDAFIALEMAMDHLERIPDYYSRLVRLESDAVSERLSNM